MVRKKGADKKTSMEHSPPLGVRGEVSKEKKTHQHGIHQHADQMDQRPRRIQQQDIRIQTDQHPTSQLAVIVVRPRARRTRPRRPSLHALIVFLRRPRQTHIPLQPALEQRVVEIGEDFVRHVGVPDGPGGGVGVLAGERGQVLVELQQGEELARRGGAGPRGQVEGFELKDGEAEGGEGGGMGGGGEGGEERGAGDLEVGDEGLGKGVGSG